MLARIAEAVKSKGALAGLRACAQQHERPQSLLARDPVGAVDGQLAGLQLCDPVQVRAMDKEDIRNFRKWHREAAMRAKRAGFDIVYVYAGQLTCALHFLSRRFNQRTDEYGGNLENRARLLRELIEDTKDAVGDTLRRALPPRGRRVAGPGRASPMTAKARDVMAHAGRTARPVGLDVCRLEQ